MAQRDLKKRKFVLYSHTCRTENSEYLFSKKQKEENLLRYRCMTTHFHCFGDTVKQSKMPILMETAAIQVKALFTFLNQQISLAHSFSAFHRYLISIQDFRIGK